MLMRHFVAIIQLKLNRFRLNMSHDTHCPSALTEGMRSHPGDHGSGGTRSKTHGRTTRLQIQSQKRALQHASSSAGGCMGGSGGGAGGGDDPEENRVPADKLPAIQTKSKYKHLKIVVNATTFTHESYCTPTGLRRDRKYTQ